MEKNQLSFAGWFTSQVTFVVTSFYVLGIAPVMLYRWKIIPVSELVLTSYWVTAVMSAVVILLTIVRWVLKYPTSLTWLQTFFGIVSTVTLIFSYNTLYGYYNGFTESSGSNTGLIVITLIATFAVYLTKRAWEGRFHN